MYENIVTGEIKSLADWRALCTDELTTDELASNLVEIDSSGDFKWKAGEWVLISA